MQLQDWPKIFQDIITCSCFNAHVIIIHIFRLFWTSLFEIHTIGDDNAQQNQRLVMSQTQMECNNYTKIMLERYLRSRKQIYKTILV